PADRARYGRGVRARGPDPGPGVRRNCCERSARADQDRSQSEACLSRRRRGRVMLVLDKVNSYYGSSQILFDVCLRVGDGEVVTLLGRNGMGKTTTVSTIMGVVPARRGAITFANAPI